MARTSVFALSAFALLALARPQGSNLDDVLNSVVAQADGVPVPTSWTTIQATPVPGASNGGSDDIVSGDLGPMGNPSSFDPNSVVDPGSIMCGDCSDPNATGGSSPMPDSTDMSLVPIPTNSGIVPPWMLSDIPTGSAPAGDVTISSAPAYTPPPRITSSSSSSRSTSSRSSSSTSSSSRPTATPTGAAAINKVANAGIVLAGLGLVAAL